MTPLYKSPLLTNANGMYWGHGFWGTLSTWTDKKGVRWLYAPAWGPATGQTKSVNSHGDAPSGSVTAFQVTGPDTKPMLTPVWRSVNMSVPEPVPIVNDMALAPPSGEDVKQNDSKGGLLSSGVLSGNPSGHTIYMRLMPKPETFFIPAAIR